MQDKLFLPGLRKLKRLVDGGFFGRILSVRGEFGYWVFEGDWQAAQRPSWNYRAEDGGGIVLDMFPHWHYVLEQLFGPVRVGAPPRPPRTSRRRVDEHGEPYEATADDAAYGIFELDGGVVAQINSSWAVRVNRDELVEFQVDGTDGQRGRRAAQLPGPAPRGHPEAGLEPGPAGHRARSATQWQEVPDNEEFDNGFKVQWEVFLRHVVDGRAVPLGLLRRRPRGAAGRARPAVRRARAAALEVPELAR